MLRTPKEKVTWTDEELGLLADHILNNRLRDPAASLVDLINRAQSILKADRKRSISSVTNCKNLIDLVTERCQETLEKAKAHDTLIHRLEDTLSPDEVISTQTDQEILERYADKVLQLLPMSRILQHFHPTPLLSSMPLPKLVAATAERLTAALVQPSFPVIPNGNGNGNGNGQTPSQIHHPKTKQLPVVLLVGGLPDQLNNLQGRLHDVCNLKGGPSNDFVGIRTLPKAELYIFWTRFMGHDGQRSVDKFGIPAEKRILWPGGLSELANLIRDRLTQLPA